MVHNVTEGLGIARRRRERAARRSRGCGRSPSIAGAPAILGALDRRLRDQRRARRAVLRAGGRRRAAGGGRGGPRRRPPRPRRPALGLGDRRLPRRHRRHVRDRHHRRSAGGQDQARPSATNGSPGWNRSTKRWIGGRRSIWPTSRCADQRVVAHRLVAATRPAPARPATRRTRRRRGRRACRRARAAGAIDSAIATGPATWTSTRPHLLRQLAAQRLLHRLPRLDAAARQQPVGAAGLLAGGSAAPGSDQDQGRARIRGCWCMAHPRPVEPKPPSPRALCESSSAQHRLRRPAPRTITSCAIRSPASIANGSSRSVLSSATSARRGSPRRRARARSGS